MATLLWFRNDLRLRDNAAFAAACRAQQIIPLYVLDSTDPWPVQGAAAWWLHHSLNSLDQSLQTFGASLIVKRGEPVKIIASLIKQHDIDTLVFSRNYDPHGIALESQLKTLCDQRKVECKRFAGSLLLEPEQVKNLQGYPFQVFTPYYKKCLTLQRRNGTKRLPTARPRSSSPKKFSIDDLNLVPNAPNWAADFPRYWTPGETAAHKHLRVAIDDIVEHYNDTRDFPADTGTSRLSPHLRFGELSPAQILDAIAEKLPAKIAEAFVRQLYWREFNAHLLFHFPHIDSKPFREKYSAFPWQKNKRMLKLWQRGKTGYPIVDAAMRELWHSGWMHNRCRMIVASFLTKHLMIHWREGALWFWDTLVDADLANNIGGWQWTAGCGADAAPYFRIFNPVTQSQKFDPNGDYVRRWLPELSALPNKYLHAPWTAPDDILLEAKIKLGREYPLPIVEHSSARQSALTAYHSFSR